MHGFEAKDGWFIMQVGREPQFDALVALIGHPEWIDDPRFATRAGLARAPRGRAAAGDRGLGVRAGTRSRRCDELGRAGIAAGPCFSDEEVVADPHVAARHMLVEMPRTRRRRAAGADPRQPGEARTMADGPETRVPWLGEHTDEVLAEELAERREIDDGRGCRSELWHDPKRG